MDQSEWQGGQGASWAAEWRRTDRSFVTVTEKLLESSRSFNFDQVLDVGCGAGELSLAIARGRPDTNVMGVDISPDLVSAAKSRGENRPNVSFKLADAAKWTPAGDFCPQLIISRHGVMFFEDPPAAFANLARIASQNAGLLFSCFRTPAENPFFTEVARLLPDPPPAPPKDAPGPFAFADKSRIISILAAGGWMNINAEAFDFEMVVGGGEDPVEDSVAYFAKIGPAAIVARSMEKAAKDQFFDRVRRLASDNCSQGIVSLPAAGWIVSATKA